MAETLKFTKGMIKDTGRIDQVDGSYRDALNLIVDDLKLNVGNEYGTVNIAGLHINVTLPNGSQQNVPINPVGQIPLLDDNFIIFGSGSYLVVPIGNIKVSTIHKINVANHTSTLLYYTTSKDELTGDLPSLGDLNFDTAYPITTELRISPVQEEIVYFTDNKYNIFTDTTTGIEYVKEYNPPRVFNISKQEESLALTNDPKNLYGSNKRTEYLNLFIDSGRIPEFGKMTILKGGGVVTGAYYLGVAYADDDKTETNVLTVSNPVYIVPADDDTIPRESISGAPNNTQTSKSIKWGLTNVNIEYKYIVPYVIQYSGNARFVYKLQYVDISSPIVDVVYSGLEKVASSSIEEAVIDKVRYLTAKSIAQLDNKLYAANLTSRPELGFQRFANNIKIEPTVEEITPFDPRRYDIYNLNEGYAQLVYPDVDTTLFPPVTDQTTSGLYPKGTYGTIPFTHLEGIDGITDSYVASVIAPIQNQNTYGQAGYRDPELLFKKKGFRRGEVYAFYISFILKDGSETYAYHIPGRKSIEAFEKDWNLLPNLGAFGSPFKSGEILAYDASGLPYQYLDTSYMGSIPLQSNMGYWENKNEIYPQTPDFETWTVDSLGQGVLTNSIGVDENVRHHKMPSNHNNAYSHVIRDTYFGDPDISADDATYLTKSSVRVFKDRVRILGIKIENLKIPKFILSQVQGYKIYYAKRTHGNKTIIGQSGAHPATSYLASNLVTKTTNSTSGPFFNIWACDGHLKYGGLVISESLWTPLPSVGGVINWDGTKPTNYIGNPVIKFHDFTLLRKKPTVATATHIDIQYIVTMESWRGGYKGAYASSVEGAEGYNTSIKYFKSFRSGVGDDTFAWIHPDLGNMIDFDEADEDSIFWDTPGPRLLWGNVYIAAKYNTPGTSFIDTGTAYSINFETKYLGDINNITNIATNQSSILSNTQTIFMLEPDGATYINGLSVLKATSSTSFKGATYIYNAFGESGLMLGMSSGLPMLGGFRSNEWSYIGLGQLMWSLQQYGSADNDGNPTSFYQLIGGFDPDFYSSPNMSDNNNFEGDINFWYGMMTRGHSSLRQPYGIPVPSTAGNALPVDSFTATVTTGLNTGTSVTNASVDILPGMYVTCTTAGVVPSGGVFISSIDLDTNSVVFSEDLLQTGTFTFAAYGVGGIAGQPVNDPRTRPNVYLVNLCSTKTDVFEPFDQQQLVWTGYYKSLLNVDLETGVDSIDNNNYYADGESISDSIFGGDTYLCKYSYRTTSNLNGLGRFARGINRYIQVADGSGSSDDYIFGDIPVDLNTGLTPSFGNNIFGQPNDYEVLFMGGSQLIGQGGDEFTGRRRNAITYFRNWTKKGKAAFSTIYQFIVESDDNINYRHSGDPEAGVSEVNSMYFDKYTAADVLWRSPLGDLTKMDNLLYEDHYSALQDIRVSIPYPKEATLTQLYPNRVIRSNVQDGNFNDTYRYFLGLQFKDFAVNKGEITNIFSLKALLYIHTERSLFRTKGKQNLELTDATQAYIGTGDLFAQEPDEFIQSAEGYNGLYNKMGALVTKDGYIFVSRKSRKIFLVKDEVIDLTNLGISAWARENIPFALEAYGWDPDYLEVPTDSPTATFGFLVSYDPLFKRTLITKRELVPTLLFIEEFNAGNITYSLTEKRFYTSIGAPLPVAEGLYFEKGGWTISFSNSLSVWASRHSYIPALYAYNSKYLYSFNIMDLPQGTTSYMFEHSDLSNPCNFYDTIYNFEIDCIFTAGVNALYSSFKYTTDVFLKTNYSLPLEQQFNPGFTSFYVYNTVQISGEVDLLYLNNVRKVDNSWSVNAFRDLSAIAYNTGLASGQIDVQGNVYNGTFTSTSTAPMFNSEGNINPNYINSTKPWYEQRKFVDKFLGIRLISNNLNKTLINLYSVSVSARVSSR
jgi:hypothetical protein